MNLTTVKYFIKDCGNFYFYLVTSYYFILDFWFSFVLVVRLISLSFYFFILCLKQQEFRVNTLEKLSTEMDSIANFGSSLMKAAPPGVDTTELESTLHSLTTRLNKLNQKVTTQNCQ